MMPGGTSGQPLSHDLSVQSESAFFYLLVGSVSHRLSTCEINVCKIKEKPEMEFLGINLTKDSSLLLHAIYSHFWRILKKPHFSSLVFNHHSKKSGEKEKHESIHE
jgi:hypothetical protein